MKKILLTALFLFLAYNALLWFWKPSFTFSQNQWQKNWVSSQEYLYSLENYEDVVVGSSLAARLAGKELPSSCYNLAFSGGSVLTGLELIRVSKKTPKRIWIETNFLSREPDLDFLHKVASPAWIEIRRYFPALQEKNQPSNYVQLFASEKASIGTGAKLDSSVFKKLVKEEELRFAVSTPSELWVLRIRQLRALIHELKKNGAEICFFEMPMYPSLRASFKMGKERDELLMHFPTHLHRWHWVKDWSEYSTTDALHLDAQSAKAFTELFTSWVEELRKKSLQEQDSLKKQVAMQ